MVLIFTVLVAEIRCEIVFFQKYSDDDPPCEQGVENQPVQPQIRTGPYAGILDVILSGFTTSYSRHKAYIVSVPHKRVFEQGSAIIIGVIKWQGSIVFSNGPGHLRMPNVKTKGRNGGDKRY